MKVKNITLTTSDLSHHELKIVTEDGVITELVLNADQLILLMYQITGTVWTCYTMVPRGQS